MIIYLPNIQSETFNKLCTANALYLNTENEFIFYSDYGIFTLKNNTFYKQAFESKNIEIIKKSNIEMMIDNSLISYKPLFSQIPSDCVVKTVKRKKYQINDVVFVVVSHDDNIFDAYIDTRMNISNPLLEKTINSFLIE